ncbi:coagulation factor XIII B chain-like isoform X2 [Aquarana catesbeiana]|uniref:coagulation factor XIII B chain-like isoform X2 n=1 Tax=Aquarana catesbeiana TaxID=8400 RepID=UPI003CC97BD6
MNLPAYLLVFFGVLYCTAEPASVSEAAPGNEESCSRPPTVQNGDITEIPKLNYPSGSFVRYKCINFYKLEGNEIIRCKGGEWEQAPTCREPCIVTTAAMLQNNIHLKYKIGDDKTRKLYVIHFDSMTFECVPGYEIADTKRLRTQCLNGVVKYPKCLKQGYCTLQETEMALKNIRYRESTEIENGQAIVFECTEGMVPEESMEAKCQNSHIKYPRCIAPRTCDPPEISNGKLIPKQDRYDAGSSINIECEDLYVHNGQNNAICENGQWRELPQCLKPCTVSSSSLDKNHIELISPEDALMTHEHGTEIRVKCKRKFKRRGHLLAFCHDGVMKYQRCFSGSTCQLDQEQMDDNFIELDDKHDGESLYREGETVQFKCKAGYFNRTSLTATCAKPVETESVSVEPTLAYPTCIRLGQSCGPPPSIQNGEIVGVKNLKYPSGSIVNYKCANWYTLEGKAVTCRHGEWDAKPVCRAPCIVRSTDMLQNNIRRKYALPEDKMKELYSENLDSIAFECTPGYGIPDEKSLRIQCMDGVLKYPKCLKEGFCVIQQHEMALKHIRYNKGTVIENGQSVVFECAEGMVPLNNLEGKCERRHINYPKCISTTSCIVRSTEMLQNNIRLKYASPEDNMKEIYSENLDSITFECTPGYGIPDEKSLRIQCLEGVLKYPKCLKEGFCVIQQHEMALNHIRYNKGTVIENGQPVVFECTEGMVPLNSLEGKCERRHINYPKCISTRYGESCGQPPIILNGDSVDTKKPSYQSGSSVKYKCANFYVIEGNELITCRDGEWGKEPTCRAPCTVTTSTMLANNIRLKFKIEEDKTKKIYLSHLDHVSFECAPGHNILDTKNLRTQCLDGVVTYPKCL